MAKQVHNYKLLNVIGSGEFGKVYKAEHQNTKQTFAVKQITNNIFQQNPKLKEFTVNEIQSLQKIDNPHVVKFIELIQTQNNLYFIYEYCNGGTLEQMILDKTRLSEQETLDIMKQILQGMLSVVNLNILHRDLKPQNILIHDKIIKIVDFGFCKPIEENSMTKTMLGSPIYMAPEILKGCDYGSQADIWSLGILMYEMLYGFCPYDAKNIAQLINVLDEKPLEFNENIQVSESSKAIMKMMMNKDVQMRISWDNLFDFFQIKKKQQFDLQKFKQDFKINTNDSSPKLFQAHLAQKKTEQQINKDISPKQLKTQFNYNFTYQTDNDQEKDKINDETQKYYLNNLQTNQNQKKQVDTQIISDSQNNFKDINDNCNVLSQYKQIDNIIDTQKSSNNAINQENNYLENGINKQSKFEDQLTIQYPKYYLSQYLIIQQLYFQIIQIIPKYQFIQDKKQLLYFLLQERAKVMILFNLFKQIFILINDKSYIRLFYSYLQFMINYFHENIIKQFENKNNIFFKQIPQEIIISFDVQKYIDSCKKEIKQNSQIQQKVEQFYSNDLTKLARATIQQIKQILSQQYDVQKLIFCNNLLDAILIQDHLEQLDIEINHEYQTYNQALKQMDIKQLLTLIDQKTIKIQNYNK